VQLVFVLKILNVRQNQIVCRVNFESKVSAFVWSSYLHRSEESRIIVALEGGKMAVVKLIRQESPTACMDHYLSTHEASAFLLKEDPMEHVVTSVGFDRVLIVWENQLRMEAESKRRQIQNRGQKEVGSMLKIGQFR